jgi:hypothetical protein
MIYKTDYIKRAIYDANEEIKPFIKKMCADVYQCEYELKIDVPDPHDPHDAVAMLVTNISYSNETDEYILNKEDFNEDLAYEEYKEAEKIVLEDLNEQYAIFRDETRYYIVEDSWFIKIMISPVECVETAFHGTCQAGAKLKIDAYRILTPLSDESGETLYRGLKKILVDIAQEILRDVFID